MPARNILTLINNIWHRCHACTRSRGGPAHYFILVISFHFFPPLFLSLISLTRCPLFALEMRVLSRALNAINFPLVSHLCLILNNPVLIIRKLRNLSEEIHAAIFTPYFALNLFALSDTQNIVTPDTQHRGSRIAAWSHSAPPRSAFTKGEAFHDATREAKVKVSIKGRKKKRPSDIW